MADDSDTFMIEWKSPEELSGTWTHFGNFMWLSRLSISELNEIIQIIRFALQSVNGQVNKGRSCCTGEELTFEGLRCWKFKTWFAKHLCPNYTVWSSVHRQPLITNKPATIRFSTIQYVSRYSCHDTIHYITTKQEGYCLASCSWAQKSVQLTLEARMRLCPPSWI